MNNKNFIEMAKKTVFTGVINGEMFDNVQAYNARMNELVAAGIEDICASSSTEIKFEEDTTNEYTTTTTQDVATPVDEDLTIYPYMCEDDPFYLDLLVTDDPVTNQEAYAEAQKKVEKAYKAKDSWARSAMLNVAKVGKFTSDRTIQEYVDDIWHLDKVEIDA